MVFVLSVLYNLLSKPPPCSELTSCESNLCSLEVITTRCSCHADVNDDIPWVSLSSKEGRSPGPVGRMLGGQAPESTSGPLAEVPR